MNTPPPKLVQIADAGSQTAAEQPAQPAKTERDAVDELCDFVLKDCTSSFDHFQKWCIESGNDEQAASYSGFQDVPEALAKRLLRAKAGLKTGLAALAL